MKGVELFLYCVEKKYISKKDREYNQTLYTLSMHLGADFFPLLEKAERENKRLCIVDNPELIINDQYTLEDVIMI
ncbi:MULTISPECIES: hypothetical protein [Flavobacteriaceae]|uniref:Uncharacterized protein n=2 Tax=Flavobacteriaceae TaxID=49546 RepID=A0A4Y8ARW6_9FLAO|nr:MULTISPECIES: hypothetical protein [Flavobacteriaceae]TEW73904.1 hypothetical protein E2488_10525 [Gramella jeungdoensis]